MIPTLIETLSALYGASRLIRFDPRGLFDFDPTTGGCYRSFFAAALVAPLYALILAVRFSGDPGETASDPVRFAVVNAIAYIIGWTAYPNLMDRVTVLLDCRERFVLHVTVYNWTAAVQYAVIAIIVFLTAAGLLPQSIAATLWMATITFFLIVSWYIARLTLLITAFQALGVVAIDLVLSLIVSGISDRMV